MAVAKAASRTSLFSKTERRSERKFQRESERKRREKEKERKEEQDAQLPQRDRVAGCVTVFAKSRRLELGDNILRTL